MGLGPTQELGDEAHPKQISGAELPTVPNCAPSTPPTLKPRLLAESGATNDQPGPWLKGDMDLRLEKHYELIRVEKAPCAQQCFQSPPALDRQNPYCSVHLELTVEENAQILEFGL